MVFCITKDLLDKKRLLSKVWLAAHWEKKIKRAQIFEVDIVKSVQDILQADIILDLRISGHLLFGIVRIHSRKTKYLLNECNSIFYQVKVFRTKLIDLPENKRTATVNDITLTEFFDNFNGIEDNLIDSMFTLNQTLIDEITLKETSENLSLLDDNDLNFVFQEEDEPFAFEDFIQNFDSEASQIKHFDVPVSKNAAGEKEKSCNKKQTNVTNSYKKDKSISKDLNLENFIDEIPETIENIPDFLNEDEVIPLPVNLDSPNIDFNHESSDKLQLEPVRIVQTSNIPKNKKAKKTKRKLRIDYIKSMSFEIIKKQVLDTSDITSILDLTPATKRLMNLKEIGCAENLLKLPTLRFQNSTLLKLYQRNLKTHKCDDSEFFDSDSEEDSFENVNVPEEKDTNKELPKNFVSTPINIITNNMENNTEDFLDCNDNFMFDAEPEYVTTNKQSGQKDQLVPDENFLTINEVQTNGSNNIQCTQVSKTSDEKWESVLQGKLIQMLQHLKLLFDKQSVVCFSSLTQNKTKSMVAQQFLCLLMLKKFEIISLKQKESFGEISISPQDNFGASTQFDF